MRNHDGRHDFRGANFGVYCIDGAGTSFLDDAFSVDPDTREVFIHITDVQGLVPAGRYVSSVVVVIAVLTVECVCCSHLLSVSMHLVATVMALLLSPPFLRVAGSTGR